MKKIISLLLTAATVLGMCINVFAFTPVSGFTIIDSAYSSTLDMYVIMAKNLTTADHQAQLYRSNDGIEWTPCFKSTKPGKNYASNNSRQELVWWESEKIFVAQLGGIAYTSKDGVSWVQSAVIKGSNSVIETDGKILAMGAGRNINLYKNASDNPETISVSTNSNVYLKGMAIYPNEDKYLGLDGSTYGGTGYLVSGDERTVSTSSPALKQTPLDTIHIPGTENWLVVLDKLPSFSLLTSPSEAKSIVPKTAEGENKEYVTSVGVGDRYVIAGTVSGKLYYIPIEDVYSDGALWNTVEAVEGTEIPSTEIRTITKSRDGIILAASTVNTFLLEETESGVIYADTTKINIEAKTTRIEAPQNGSEKIGVELSVKDFFSREITGAITSARAADAADDMTAEWKDEKLSINVSDTAEGDRDFIITDKYGAEHTVTIGFVKESAVQLSGYETIALPEKGEENIRVKYAPSVLASDGEVMDREARITLVSAPKGVTFDSETNYVTATADGEPGELVLRVTSAGKPENTKDFTVTVTKRQPTTIEVTTDRNEILISETGDVKISISAVVKDQVNGIMKNEAVSWSIEGDSEGIIIDEEKGSITVKTAARSGKKYLVATSVTDSNVVGKKELSFIWVDSRCVKEDLAAFDNSIVTDKNLPFVSITENGTKMTYKTSDSGVITNTGVITRDRREDKYATVTVTASKNDDMDSKTIKVTVLRADNIADIGGFEEGSAEIENGTVTADEAHSGDKSLKADKSISFDVAELEDGAVYVFEAYVKSAQKVKIATEKSTASALSSGTNKWERIVINNYYSKAGDSFTETVRLTAGGDFYVDDIRVYDITPEYREAAEAVSKAEYSKKAADKTAAQKILNSFYDVPAKQELQTRLDKVSTGSGSGSGSGGSSGASSGGSSGSYIPPVQNTSGAAVVGTDTKENNQELIEDYLLVFKDLKGHWAKDDIEFMADLEIVSGVDESSFKPDANITRAEFTKLVVKTMGLSEAAYENTYYDVTSDDWFAGFVQTAKNEGYVTGFDGLFRPDDFITREEIAKIIVSAYYKKTKKTLEVGGAMYFNDIPEMSAWAYDYIAAATKEGFVNGVTELRFAPRQNATRAQAVVMLKRLYDKLGA